MPVFRSEPPVLSYGDYTAMWISSELPTIPELPRTIMVTAGLLQSSDKCGMLDRDVQLR